ncbi:Ig-like domain-containing protein, partial [Flavobacterium sp.]|uniref:Ig-like domain-containing protein n=2 Tax=Flavobacterium sp. TaxID=239 RepID=UPI002FDA04E7
MKITTLLHKIVLVTIALFSFSGFSQNLLVNGDFESGGSGTGFQTNYFLPATVGNSAPREYNIIADSFTMNTANFAHTTDHSGAGKMMVVDGSGNGGDKIWELLNGSSIGVVSGTTYQFSYWIRSISATNNAGNSAVIGINTNGTTTAPVLVGGSATCPIGNPSAWTKVTYSWTATTNNAQIWITDTQTAGGGAGNDFALDDFSLIAVVPCPVPTVSVTQQPTCAVPTGTIVFTSPLNPSPIPIPSDLFISEVTDEDVGALTYVEIFNGTGVTKNLANYRLKVYNNGNALPSCDLLLSGTLANNSVVVIAVGSATNQGGVTPNLVFAACGGVNTDDNIRLTTSANVEIDLWGRTDGVAFTPAGAAGYTYRRLATVTHPSLIWNPADWTALDPQDYTNVGSYFLASYQYSVNAGTTYQTSPTFSGLIPGNYNAQIKDLISGCISNPIPLTVNPISVAAAPTVTSPVTYCQNAVAVPLTATPSAGGTLNWYGTNAVGGVASATAPTPSTTTLGSVNYYVSQTVGGCEGPRAMITVTVTNTAPSGPPQLFCNPISDPINHPNSVNFDFNNIGQTDYTYTYSIDGGPSVSGVWISPSNFWVPNVAQGQTVSFTLTWNGVCAPTLSASTTVPSFVQVGPYCSGQAIPVLPTTSANGKVGTWSPALDNTTTTTYTFMPNLGQCASVTTMTIVINPNVTPTFTAVAPICSGQALAPLPTTSTNGITGTWSPALNNTATTLYTFTPTAGQCATTATLSITVNPNVTPTFTAVAPICSGQALAPLPTTSNNGITGTWSPALNNTATTLYTFTPTAGQCATTATLTITVNPNVTPTFTAVGPICSGAPLSPLPTTSNNGITGTWSPALNNTATTVYTFTPTAGQCAVTTTLSITVNPNVTPTFTAVAPICSGQALAPLPTTSNNGITGTWSPALNNTATTLYTFTPTAGQCATTATLSITVNPNVTPIFTAVAPVCTGTVLSPLPTTSNNGITGTWSPALNNTTTTTYTFTPTAGQCATNQTVTITILPKVTPTFNAVAPICSGAPLSPLPTTSNNGITGSWTPALNNTATTTYTFAPNAGECANTTTLQIDVVPLVTPTLNIIESCNSNSVTVLTPVGIDYEYSLDGLPYQSSPFFNNLVSGNHDIVAHQIPVNCLSNPVNFVMNSVANDVVVNPNPPALQVCDPNNDGFANFNLTQAINSITGGTFYNVTFHETLTDATVDGSPIPNPNNYFSILPWTQPIYVRVESLTTSCFEVVQLLLIANSTPVVLPPSDYVKCDYTGA